ncbi:uncharacterized protein LOC126904037 [Daktulosphaira vitifoliae]|uniref:uncharacterized protein LOC126904037 n=1 Tax=Daktulosphaira vitifoliae TaxID=58002 RepID=UPI0021AA0FE9|nr:uncharacterized protein LOC126904037 [Daktulosphaira vitifoliae]
MELWNSTLMLVLASLVLINAEADKANEKPVEKKQSKRGLWGLGYGGDSDWDGLSSYGLLGSDHSYGHVKSVHITKEVPVLVDRPIVVPVEKHVPYPVAVEKAVPYPVHVEKHVPVPYPVKVHVKVPVAHPVPYPVYIQKHVPVYVKDHHDHSYGHSSFDFGHDHGFGYSSSYAFHH